MSELAFPTVVSDAMWQPSSKVVIFYGTFDGCFDVVKCSFSRKNENKRQVQADRHFMPKCWIGFFAQNPKKLLLDFDSSTLSFKFSAKVRVILQMEILGHLYQIWPRVVVK